MIYIKYKRSGPWGFRRKYVCKLHFKNHPVLYLCNKPKTVGSTLVGMIPMMFGQSWISCFRRDVLVKMFIDAWSSKLKLEFKPYYIISKIFDQPPKYYSASDFVLKQSGILGFTFFQQIWGRIALIWRSTISKYIKYVKAFALYLHQPWPY